jgi:hypothetical protein
LEKASKAIIISLIAIPLKYTAVISGLPIIILAVSKIRHEFQKIGPLEVAGCLAMLAVTALWLFNNYSYTSSPFYPLLMSVFPYSGDGVMNANEYKRVIATLLNSRMSLRLLSYLLNTLNILLLSLVEHCFFYRYFRCCFRAEKSGNLYTQERLILFSDSVCSIALGIFLLILLSEFQVCIHSRLHPRYGDNTIHKWFFE